MAMPWTSNYCLFLTLGAWARVKKCRVLCACVHVCVCVSVCVFEREKRGGEMDFVRWPSNSPIRAPQGRGFKHVNPNRVSHDSSNWTWPIAHTSLIQVLAFPTNTECVGVLDAWPWEPGMVGLRPQGNSPYPPSLLPRLCTCDMMDFLTKYTSSNSDYLTLKQTCSS